MNFSTLSSNEKLAAYGAIAAIIGTLLTVFGGLGGAGGLWLTLLLAIAMLVIVFLPQFSPQTSLPGSKGSLMLIVGGIAALGAVFALLALFTVFAFIASFPLYVIGLLVGIIGGLLMGWAGWQEFQAEGGQFRVGGGGGTTSAPPRSGPPSGPTSTNTTGSTVPPPPAAGSTSAGSTDMGSEGPSGERDEEGGYRNP